MPETQIFSEGNMSRPTVSVIVATRNAKRTLSRCLDSIVRQNVECEIIGIDAVSDDGTQDVFDLYQSNLGFFVSEKDDGIYSAWNKALNHVRGEWVCFLGADDSFADEHTLEELINSRMNNARLLYGRARLLSRDGREQRVIGEPWESAFPKLKFKMSIPNPSAMYHSSLFADYGNFDEKYRVAGDYEFLLRIANSESVHFINKVLANVELGGVSGRKELAWLILGETWAAREQNGINVGLIRRIYEVSKSKLNISRIWAVVDGNSK